MKKTITTLSLLLVIFVCKAQNDSLQIKLKKYKELYTNGLISESEYEILRKKALGLQDVKPSSSAKTSVPSSTTQKNSQGAKSSTNVQVPKSKNRIGYCWYGYQEKKTTFDYSGSEVTGYSVINYVSNIIEVSIPNNITDDEASEIVGNHVKNNCPVVETPSGKGYIYIITYKARSGIIPSYEQALKNRDGNTYLTNPITFDICSKEKLQTRLSNAQHYSFNEPNNSGISMFCVVDCVKYSYDKQSGGLITLGSISAPIKIKCASKDNMNILPDLLKSHIKKFCSIPDGYIVGVSDFVTYQAAIDHIHEYRGKAPQLFEYEVCNIDLFQNDLCNYK